MGHVYLRSSCVSTKKSRISCLNSIFLLLIKLLWSIFWFQQWRHVIRIFFSQSRLFWISKIRWDRVVKVITCQFLPFCSSTFFCHWLSLSFQFWYCTCLFFLNSCHFFFCSMTSLPLISARWLLSTLLSRSCSLQSTFSQNKNMSFL